MANIFANMKVSYFIKFVFILGCIPFFSTPVNSLAGDTPTITEGSDKTDCEQFTENYEKDSNFNTEDKETISCQSGEISQFSRRHARLQTINNIIRSQQTVQRLSHP